MTKRKPASPPPTPLAIRMVPAASLRLHPKNSRTHSADQVDLLARSIQKFGWTNPIVVNGEQVVLAGAGRLLAARKLGLANVPVIDRADMTDADQRAYIIADNRLAERAGWDEALLSLEISALLGEGFSDPELLGENPAESRELSDEIPVVDLEFGNIADEFWAIVEGPIIMQAEFLQRLAKLIEDLPGVTIKLGNREREGLL